MFGARLKFFTRERAPTHPPTTTTNPFLIGFLSKSQGEMLPWQGDIDQYDQMRLPESLI